MKIEIEKHEKILEESGEGCKIHLKNV